MSVVSIPFGSNASIVGTKIDSSVNRFTGIPYALPPTGDNRWKQPRKLPANYFQSLGRPYDATAFKDICLQPPSPVPLEETQHATVMLPLISANLQYSEDCLYVNVWAPSSDPPAGGWPVIIWIHGGWLQLGDPMLDERMQPWELISKNGYGFECVVVAPGYRLGVFGFLGADVDGELPGNWGFWDQRCAIEWVAENVKYFGGNSGNITLGGVSAGSSSTFRAGTDDRCVFNSGAIILRTFSGCGSRSETAIS
jgi:carboxylesterase type B